MAVDEEKEYCFEKSGSRGFFSMRFLSGTKKSYDLPLLLLLLTPSVTKLTRKVVNNNATCLSVRAILKSFLPAGVVHVFEEHVSERAIFAVQIYAVLTQQLQFILLIQIVDRELNSSFSPLNLFQLRYDESVQVRIEIVQITEVVSHTEPHCGICCECKEVPETEPRNDKGDTHSDCQPLNATLNIVR